MNESSIPLSSNQKELTWEQSKEYIRNLKNCNFCGNEIKTFRRAFLYRKLSENEIMDEIKKEVLHNKERRVLFTMHRYDGSDTDIDFYFCPDLKKCNEIENEKERIIKKEPS